jgi:catechol 2,3-dioxygenase-like lactoylglutathione lyase family enzyme
MLYDITLGTNDLPRAIRFYQAVMAVLGQQRLPDEAEGWAGWAPGPAQGVALWLCPPFDGAPATVGNGTMVTLRATSAAQVRAFHAAGLAHGGTDAGPPGLRAAYRPDFYVAYLRDPDGHKLACVFPHYSGDPD